MKLLPYIANPLNYYKLMRSNKRRMLGFSLVFFGFLIATQANFAVVYGVPIEKFEFVRTLSVFILDAFLIAGTLILSQEHRRLKHITYIFNLIGFIALLYVLSTYGVLGIYKEAFMIQWYFELGQILILMSVTYKSLKADYILQNEKI